MTICNLIFEVGYNNTIASIEIDISVYRYHTIPSLFARIGLDQK